MCYTFFFNVDAVVCQNKGQFQVWELNIWQFIVIVEIKYFLNLNEYYLPIFILSIHFRQVYSIQMRMTKFVSCVLSRCTPALDLTTISKIVLNKYTYSILKWKYGNLTYQITTYISAITFNTYNCPLSKCWAVNSKPTIISSYVI